MFVFAHFLFRIICDHLPISIICINLIQAISLAKDLEKNADTYQEAAKLMDQELCNLKTRCGIVDLELEDLQNELKITCHELDKYKEKLDKLHKLAEY